MDKGESSGSGNHLGGDHSQLWKEELKEMEEEKQGGGSFILVKWAAVSWSAGKAEDQCSDQFSNFISIFA